MDFGTLVSRMKKGTGLIALLLLYLASNYHIYRINTIVETHRGQLEAQRLQLDHHAEVVRRGLHELLDGTGSTSSSTAPETNELARRAETAEAANDHYLAIRGLLDSLESGISSLTGSLTSSVSSELSNLTGEAATGLENDLVEPSKYLGVGLASGALTGMNMTVKMDASVEPQPTGLNGMAQNLGSGLTSTVVKSTSGLIDINSLIASGASGAVGQASLAFAQGLGGGTVTGLKLNSKNLSATPAYNISGVTGIAGNFGQGLTSTVFGNINMQQLQLPQMSTNIKSLLTDPATLSMVADAASGLGIGLGQGSAVGLGLQSPGALTVAKRQTGSTITIGQITQNFASGLTSSFLQNGTLTNLKAAFAPGGSLASLTPDTSSLQNIKINQVAEGFAVGLISGAGSVVPRINAFAANTNSFNDSVQGAAVGFGNGLGSEGAYLVSQFLGLGGTTPPAGSTAPTVPSATNTTVKRRYRRSVQSDQRSALVIPRQDVTDFPPVNITNATDIASFIASVNATALDPMIQVAINDLTCTGTGGFAAIGFGLLQSGTLDLNQLKQFSFPKPNQTFEITSDGNTYTFNAAEGLTNTTVNGSQIIKFAVVLVLHILFAIVVYFTVVPLLLLDHSRRNIGTLFGAQAARAPVWQTYLTYSVFPLALIILILGIVARGDAKHFNTVHGGLGLLVFIQTVIAGVLAPLVRTSSINAADSRNPIRIAQKANFGVFVLLSHFLLATGFSDLSTLTLCSLQTVLPTAIVILLGLGLNMPILLAQGFLMVEYYLRRRKLAPVRNEDQSEEQLMKISWPKQDL